MRATGITVTCDAQSHATKVVTVSHLPVGYGAEARGRNFPEHVDRRQLLIDDEVVDRRALFGTATQGPTDRRRNYRERRVMECPLCGLRVDLRDEKLREIARRLEAADVSSVTLSALTAIL